MTKKYTYFRQLISLCIVMAFVYITSLSLLIAFSHTDAHDHTATPTTHTCPFMAHITSWCPMVMAEHIDTWRQMTTLLIPSLSLLYLTFFVTHQKYNTHNTDIQPGIFTNTRVIQRIYHWIAQLFSQGILHTKIP